MPLSYFAYGTSLSGLANIETLTVQSYEPHVLPAAAAPLLGGIKRRPLSGKSRRDGAAIGAIGWDALQRTEYRALLLALLGSLTVQSRQMFVTTIDELGYWSPFQCFIDRPVLGDDYEDSNGEWMTAVVFTLYDLRLQSVTKTALYTITASDRLVYGDTTSAGFTLTLPAASAVAADTIVSVEKIAAANTLTIQRAGGDTVNGGTSVALTALRGRFDLVSNGSNAWRSVVV